MPCGSDGTRMASQPVLRRPLRASAGRSGQNPPDRRDRSFPRQVIPAARGWPPERLHRTLSQNPGFSHSLDTIAAWVLRRTTTNPMVAATAVGQVATRSGRFAAAKIDHTVAVNTIRTVAVAARVPMLTEPHPHPVRRRQFRRVRVLAGHESTRSCGLLGFRRGVKM